MSRNLIILLLVCLAGYYLHKPQNAANLESIPEFGVAYDTGLSIEKTPIQKNVSQSRKTITAGDYTITPLAEFQVAARVLGTRHYSLGREASLSPTDLALGWGPMADDTVLDKISITQSGRFYRWRTANFPIPRREIETNSANMHIIPATPEVEKQLKEIDEGDHIKFKGYLVRVEASDGWRWISSTTREDTGAGACEIILTDDITLL